MNGLGRQAELIAFDREHVWHPYSSALAPSTPYLVGSASGVRLRLRRRNGQVCSVIDAMSCWWCACTATQCLSWTGPPATSSGG